MKQMSRFTYLLASLAIAILVVGCDKESPPITSQLPTPALVADCQIPEESRGESVAMRNSFTIGLVSISGCDGSSDNPAGIGIRQSSVGEYATSGYTILSESVVSEGAIEINLLDAIRPTGIVLMQPQPARTTSIYEVSNGTYNLNIILGLQKDTYQLVVTDTGATLSAVSASYTQISNSFVAK